MHTPSHPLNAKQLQAVEATEGRVRVVAGAGSGKTRVLTHRFAHLVNALGIDPAHILCMTFTNKAAQEMKTRIAQLAGRGQVNDFVCTIHGFCVRLLRREITRVGYPRHFTIIDTVDAKAMATQVLASHGITRQQMTAQQFLQQLGEYKGGGYYIHHLLHGNETTPTAAIDTFLRLQAKLFALDFDDLIYMAIHILEYYPQARRYWQQELNYIQIDETQDCSEREWHLVELLAAHHGNLFVVGDPDQAIYEWRGARPEFLVNFRAELDIVLDQNYRSTPQILRVANQVIAHNANRLPKELYTTLPPAELPLHMHAPCEDEEYAWIAQRLVRLLTQGVSADQCAILYRASRLSRGLEQALQRERIPYEVWGDIRFFERREIKDALAYLRLIAQGDDLSFQRVINYPPRKFGAVSMRRLQAYSQAEGRSLYETLIAHMGETSFRREALHSFIQLVEEGRREMAHLGVSELLERVLLASGLKDYLRADLQEDALENLDELMHSVYYYEQQHADEGLGKLADYLQDIALYTNADYRESVASVKLMTVHQSKGLEFDHVFICGLTEGIFPSHRSIRGGNTRAEEEERRLMYVAITRARRGLYLTDSEGYSASLSAEKYPSRYFSEIDAQALRTEGKLPARLLEGTRRIGATPAAQPVASSAPLTVGRRVRHAVFGEGQIVQLHPQSLSYTVRFGEKERVVRANYITPIP